MIIHGAEATVSETDWMGRQAIQKARVPKTYRHEALDALIRAERTRDEAHLLVAARNAGVPVPVLFDVDRNDGTLRMERIQGQALRHVLEAEPVEASVGRFTALGAIVANMHAGGVTHGDLTTSNIIVPDAATPEGLVLIDFGLGQATEEDEPRAVDLHLMEEALEATHPEATRLMEAFISAYSNAFPRAEQVMRRLEAVRERGRYRVAG